MQLRPTAVPLALIALAACRSDAPATNAVSSAPATPAPAAAPAPQKMPTRAANLYALRAQTLEGESAALGDYAGKVTLVVNVASACGYTPQYAGLEKLHAEFAGRGFAVLGFPSNEFGAQEPGNAQQIREFCSSKYAVTFPLFAKCETKAGASQSPVYAALGSDTGELPNWNFCKYLVGRDGKAIAFYPSKVAPHSPELREAIENALR